MVREMKWTGRGEGDDAMPHICLSVYRAAVLASQVKRYNANQQSDESALRTKPLAATALTAEAAPPSPPRLRPKQAGAERARNRQSHDDG